MRRAPAPAPPPAERLAFLEGMRGVLALYVAAGHVFTMVDPSIITGRPLDRAPLAIQTSCRAVPLRPRRRRPLYRRVSGFSLQLGLLQGGGSRRGQDRTPPSSAAAPSASCPPITRPSSSASSSPASTVTVPASPTRRSRPTSPSTPETVAKPRPPHPEPLKARVDVQAQRRPLDHRHRGPTLRRCSPALAHFQSAARDAAPSSFSAPPSGLGLNGPPRPDLLAHLPAPLVRLPLRRRAWPPPTSPTVPPLKGRKPRDVGRGAQAWLGLALGGYGPRPSHAGTIPASDVPAGHRPRLPSVCSAPSAAAASPGAPSWVRAAPGGLGRLQLLPLPRPPPGRADRVRSSAPPAVEGPWGPLLALARPCGASGPDGSSRAGSSPFSSSGPSSARRTPMTASAGDGSSRTRRPPADRRLGP